MENELKVTQSDDYATGRLEGEQKTKGQFIKSRQNTPCCARR